MNKEFRLPDVGEGLTEADIVSWHVKPGDTITINQVIVEIETAKAVVELPSPFAGTVSALLVSEGQTVDVGMFANKPFDAVANNAATIGGRHHWKRSCHRFAHRAGRTFAGGWK